VFVNGVAVMSISTATPQMRYRTSVKAPIAASSLSSSIRLLSAKQNFLLLWCVTMSRKGCCTDSQVGAFTFNRIIGSYDIRPFRCTMCYRFSPDQARQRATNKHRNLQAYVDILSDKMQAANVMSDLCKLPHIHVNDTSLDP
jgi:hypothetical protein